MTYTYKYIELCACLMILLAGISAMLVVFFRNAEYVCSKGKKAEYYNERKSLVTATVYLAYLGAQLLLGMIRLFSQQFVEFTFLTLAGNVMYYFLSSFGLWFIGMLNLVNVMLLWERGKVQEIKKTWTELKIGVIIFFPLNWVHFICQLKAPEGMAWTEVFSTIVGYCFFGICVLILPCMLNFLNGCAGWHYIYYLRQKCKGGKRPSWGHYVLQAVPVLDIISMIWILKRYNGIDRNNQNRYILK